MRTNSVAGGQGHRPPAEHASLSDLYTTYSQELRVHITLKLSVAQDVEDLVQEVFLRAHRSAAADAVQYPRAYLYQIANSVITDYYRKRSRRAAFPQPPEPIEDSVTAGHEPTPEEVAIGEETCARLCSRIDRFPPKVREAVILRTMADLSYREVGETMGISVRTVEKHLARAFRELRDSIGETHRIG